MELTPRLEIAIDSGLFIITLNRGEEGNPLNPQLLAALEEALEKGFAQRDIRVVLLRSNTDTFSIGMDLVLLAEGGGEKNNLKEAVGAYSRVLNAIFTAGKPVICAVSGEVKAGGVGLVCACDIVCATVDSRFSLSEVLFGLVPANVFPYLLGYRVAPQKARYLALTTRQLNGEEALRLGIVDELAERGGMESLLKNRIRQLMRSSPEGLARVKRLTAEMSRNDLDGSRELAVKALTEIAADQSVLKALRNFADGITPPWFSTYKPSQKLFLEDTH